MPNFQNPTSRTLPIKQRQAIAGIIQRFDTLLVEDDPYGDLRYRGKPISSIKTLAPDHLALSSPAGGYADAMANEESLTGAVRILGEVLSDALAKMHGQRQTESNAG